MSTPVIIGKKKKMISKKGNFATMVYKFYHFIYSTPSIRKELKLQCFQCHSEGHYATKGMPNIKGVTWNAIEIAS